MLGFLFELACKVVVGMVDPNPVVSGSGVKTLEEAGVEVSVGVEEEACRQLNPEFIQRMMKMEQQK